MQRIAVTGSSGFYGRGMVRALRRERPDARILGLDVADPVGDGPDEFERLDVRDPRLGDRLAAFAPDTVLHLSFVVNPIRDRERMRAVNVDGTRNVLAAAERIRPRRLFVASSATAYGAWPDNPVPLDEAHPLRARTEYQYAADKVQVEGLLRDFAAAHADVATSWVRPSIICGGGIDNYLTRFILKGPLVVLPGGNDAPLQFVHLEDVADATLAILRSGARGPFNLAPPDTVALSELARMSGRLCLPVPFALCLAVTRCWWGLRLPVFHFPEGLWYFVGFPWVVSSRRLTEELGFRYRYSSRETLRQLLDSGTSKPQRTTTERPMPVPSPSPSPAAMPPSPVPPSATQPAVT